MTKQTTGYDEAAEHDGPPVIADCDRQSQNPTVTPTYPSVIPDLIGDLRAFGLAPGARRKDAKRMFREARKAGLL